MQSLSLESTCCPELSSMGSGKEVATEHQVKQMMREVFGSV